MLLIIIFQNADDIISKILSYIYFIINNLLKNIRENYTFVILGQVFIPEYYLHD